MQNWILLTRNLLVGNITWIMLPITYYHLKRVSIITGIPRHIFLFLKALCSIIVWDQGPSSIRCCKSSVRVESEFKGAVLLEQISLTVIPLDRPRIGHLPKYVLNYFILILHF